MLLNWSSFGFRIFLNSVATETVLKLRSYHLVQMPPASSFLPQSKTKVLCRGLQGLRRRVLTSPFSAGFLPNRLSRDSLFPGLDSSPAGIPARHTQDSGPWRWPLPGAKCSPDAHTACSFSLTSTVALSGGLPPHLISDCSGLSLQGLQVLPLCCPAPSAARHPPHSFILWEF